jgi:hypothetical protein
MWESLCALLCMNSHKVDLPHSLNFFHKLISNAAKSLKKPRENQTVSSPALYQSDKRQQFKPENIAILLIQAKSNRFIITFKALEIFVITENGRKSFLHLRC